MAQFYGVQSLNGIQTVSVFTAPSAGIYFIEGKLSLPQISTSGSASAVIALVKKNGSTQYTGIAGASGFSIPAITLAANDAITVQLSSSAAIDLVTNNVSGQIVYGNAF